MQHAARSTVRLCRARARCGYRFARAPGRRYVMLRRAYMTRRNMVVRHDSHYGTNEKHSAARERERDGTIRIHASQPGMKYPSPKIAYGM